MKKLWVLTTILTFTCILASCSYFQSAKNATFDQNQCTNLKRESLLTNNQYGSRETSQIRTRQMQLRSQYQKLNCDTVLAKKN